MLKWKACLRVGITIVLVYLAVHYWESVARLLGVFLSGLWPLVLGAGIAYLVNRMMRFYERHYFPRRGGRFAARTRRGVCLFASILTILLLVSLVILLIVPELIKSLQLLLNDVPALLERGYAELMRYPEIAQLLPEELTSVDAGWQDGVTRVVDWLGGGFGGLMNSVVVTVSGVFSGATTLVMAVVFAVYLLYGKERICAQMSRLMRTYLRPAWHVRVRYVLGVMDDCFHRYIVGQCIEAIILGSLCMLGMLLLGFPYATMVGTLVGATALIPIAGAYIGAIVGAIMIMTVSPIEAAFFLVFIVILQQLEGNLVYPRVVGASLKLPALWVLAAITVGGSVLGIVGMLLGVPLAATAYRLLREDVNRREQDQKTESGLK